MKRTPSSLGVSLGLAIPVWRYCSILTVLVLGACTSAGIGDESNAEGFSDERKDEPEESGVAGSAEELRKSVIGSMVGDADYCDDPTAPCDVGEGDCDSDAQCRFGNVCLRSVGARYGIGAGMDVCGPSTCADRIRNGGELNVDCGGTSLCGACPNVRYTKGVTGAVNGDQDYCTDANARCAAGEGDCDGSAECEPGLVCRPNAGPRFGLPSTADVCVPAQCVNAILDANETGLDCGGTSGCGSCTPQPPTKGQMGASNGNADYCNDALNLCATGEGDCDSNAQCSPGLVCVAGRGPQLGLKPWIDVCLSPLCVDGIQNGGEAGVDCGGTSGCGACAATCSDGVKNGTEIGTDCGGSCTPCICTPGSTGYCYTGPAGTANVGTCASGSRTCNADGSGWGACSGETLPAVDACGTPQDEDCDGVVVGCSATNTWAWRGGDATNQFARGVSTDAAGNTYVVGYFAGTVSLGGVPMVSAGSYDAFLVKYNSSGDYVWGKRFGDDGLQLGMGIDVDTSGNILIIGYFTKTVDFGTGTLTAAGSQEDVFVARFDSAGTAQWAQRFGDAPGNQQGFDISWAGTTHAVVVGHYRSTIDFGGGDLPSGTDWNAFVAKLSATDGSHTWSQGFGDSAPQTYCRSVAVDASGNVHIAGQFTGGVNFGGGVLTSLGGLDAYVAKFNSAGVHQWSNRYGDAQEQHARRIAVDSAGRVAVVGYAQGSINFGCGAVSSAGSYDIVLAQLNAAGNCQWTRIIGDAGAGQYVDALDIDDADQILFGGSFDGTIPFPTGTGTITLTSAGGRDAYAARYDRDGLYLGSARYGDASDQAIYDVSGYPQSNDGVFVGAFSGTMVVDGQTMTSGGANDMFMGRMTTIPVAVTATSVSTSGALGNDQTWESSISDDARYVAFMSESSNFVSGDGANTFDVFLRDRYLGTTVRASSDTGGGNGSGVAEYPVISDDGRYVVYESTSNDLVAGDSNGRRDCFRYDRVTTTIVRVNVSTAGTQTPNAGTSDCRKPSISSDGRYVVFFDGATNLVAGDTNALPDVFVRDVTGGTTMRVSISTSGAQGTGGAAGYGARNPTISSDGRYVAFDAAFTNLVASDTNTQVDSFIRDRTNTTTTRISVTSAGAQATGGASYAPYVSNSGRYVSFESAATNLVASDTNGVRDVFLRDTTLNTTVRVSVSTAGAQGNGHSGNASGYGNPGSLIQATSGVSSDGRFVVFESAANNLAGTDANGSSGDIFVRDVLNSITYRASTASDGVTSGNGISEWPSISANGRYLSFDTVANNLFPSDSNGTWDIVIRPRPE